jgi:6-phosphofructokinase
VVIPEVEEDPREVVERLGAAYERGKEYAIVVVAEGAEYNGIRLEKYLQDRGTLRERRSEPRFGR